MTTLRKVHLHSEQFDGVAHAWCGRGTTAVPSDVFEATSPEKRCVYCDREWFPHGQPDWHFKYAMKTLADRKSCA